jgi:hypothetical protein
VQQASILSDVFINEAKEKIAETAIKMSSAFSPQMRNREHTFQDMCFSIGLILQGRRFNIKDLFVGYSIAGTLLNEEVINFLPHYKTFIQGWVNLDKEWEPKLKGMVTLLAITLALTERAFSHIWEAMQTLAGLCWLAGLCTEIMDIANIDNLLTSIDEAYQIALKKLGSDIDPQELEKFCNISLVATETHDRVAKALMNVKKVTCCNEYDEDTLRSLTNLKLRAITAAEFNTFAKGANPAQYNKLASNIESYTSNCIPLRILAREVYEEGKKAFKNKGDEILAIKMINQDGDYQEYSSIGAHTYLYTRFNIDFYDKTEFRPPKKEEVMFEEFKNSKGILEAFEEWENLRLVYPLKIFNNKDFEIPNVLVHNVEVQDIIKSQDDKNFLDQKFLYSANTYKR